MGEIGDAAQDARQAGDRAQRSDAFRAVARVGHAANGVVHALIGAIALVVAFGGDAEADQAGAMQQLASNPLGAVLLWAVGIALAALTLHSLLTAATERGEGRDAWGTRMRCLGRAVGYGVVASTAFVYAAGGSSGGEQQSESLTAVVLAHPLGVALVVVLGLVVAGVGVFFVQKGLRRTFEREIAEPGGRVGHAVTTLGMIGYPAKGVAVAIVGVLFVVAGLTNDPESAGGLDGALKSLLGLPFGVVLLCIVAVGLIVYGVYCCARARWGRLDW